MDVKNTSEGEELSTSAEWKLLLGAVTLIAIMVACTIWEIHHPVEARTLHINLLLTLLAVVGSVGGSTALTLFFIWLGEGFRKQP